MKCFVASSLDRYIQILEIENELIRRGHQITHSWATEYTEELESGNIVTNDKELGRRCFNGVRSAQVVILVASPVGRGAHMEYGMALGLGKKSIVYCPDSSIECSQYFNVVRTLDEMYLRVIE